MTQVTSGWTWILLNIETSHNSSQETILLDHAKAGPDFQFKSFWNSSYEKKKCKFYTFYSRLPKFQHSSPVAKVPTLATGSVENTTRPISNSVSCFQKLSWIKHVLHHDTMHCWRFGTPQCIEYILWLDTSESWFKSVTKFKNDTKNQKSDKKYLIISVLG
jgi:hypothetical protein